MALHLQKAAFSKQVSCYRVSLLLPRGARVDGVLPLLPQLMCTRNKGHGNFRQNRLKNPWVQERTDFIKLLCIGLVRHERIQTTMERAKLMQRYGNLLIELTQRKQAPPDILVTLENGFLLRPDEIEEKFTTRKLINRKWKKRIELPVKLTEEEYVAQCKIEAANILLQDEVALTKLYGELAERYRGRYGGFVKITQIPNKHRKYFPHMAYVEYHENGLPPLPTLPVVRDGELYGIPRDIVQSDDHLIKLTRPTKEVKALTLTEKFSAKVTSLRRTMNL